MCDPPLVELDCYLFRGMCCNFQKAPRERLVESTTHSPVADLPPIHLLDTEAASRFLMPSFLTVFPTSGGLTHRSAP